MNGTVEATNKNIKKILQKMIETYWDWHEKLHFALFAYQTSIQYFMGATPFSLVCDMVAVLPVDIEIPSLRILMETRLEEAEWIQTRSDQLNFIEEKRMTVLCHGQCYQRRIAWAYDKKVKSRAFQEGNLVLNKISILQRTLAVSSSLTTKALL